MSEAVAAALPARPNLNTRPHVAGSVIFIVLLAIGIGYTLNGLLADIDAAHTPPVAIGAFVLLGIALLIALGFEFVNGFHDTANAVATVIYTHSLPPHFAGGVVGRLQLPRRHGLLAARSPSVCCRCCRSN